LPSKSQGGKSVQPTRDLFALAGISILDKIGRSDPEAVMFAGWFVWFILSLPPGENPQVSSSAHKDAVARFGTAIWNLRRERLLSAANQLEAAARRDPDAFAPRRELVRLYSQIGREQKAIRIARQVLERDPTDVDTAHRLATLLFDAGELKDAVAAARLAAAIELPLDRADKSVAILRDLATICEKSDEAAAAANALNRAVELLVEKRSAVIRSRAFTPKEADIAAAECLERLGRVLTKNRRFDAAATSFEQAARLYAGPTVDDPSAAARLAWNQSGVFQSKGDSVSALKYLDRFLEQGPIAPEPYERLAKLLSDAGRGNEAIPRLRRLAAASPNNLPLRAVLAAELARRPDMRREADALFREVMNVSNDPSIIALVIRSHREQSRMHEVVAEVDRAFDTLREEKKGQKPLTAETVAAREFARERLRVLGDILRSDAAAAVETLRAGTTDLEGGTKRNYQLYYYLGQLAARHNELARAKLLFEEAVRRAPPSSRDTEGTQGDAYAALIEVLRKSGMSDQVARVCRQGLAEGGLGDGFFNYYLAGALAELNDADGALAAIEKAILQSGDNNRLTVRLQKIQILRILGRWDEAIAAANKLLDEFENPSDRLRIRYAMAGTYWGAKKREDAEAELRRILDADPDYPAACNDLGYYLADQGRDLIEAERLIRLAITNDQIDRRKAGHAEPENAAYIDSLGWVLFRRGQLREAQAELERAASLHAGATNPVVWDHLGDVLFRLGEKEEAKRSWEKAQGLYENLPPGLAQAFGERLVEVKRKLKLVPQ
jgi:tetratricopeptide (TPR) repeat protein